jgi:hypothetical protein
MSTLLVEDPVGIHSIAISEKNPYKKICETNKEPEQFGDETIIYISSDLIEQVYDIEKYAFGVKLITMFDFVLNMFYYFSSGFWYAYMMSVVSLFGYIGTNNFRKKYVFVYLVYHYFASVFKIILTCLMYYSFIFKHELFVDKIVIYYLPLNMIYQCFMFYFVHKFYKLLPST